MRTDVTFTIIKPTAFQNGYTGPIIETITRNGFHLAGMKLVWMSKEQAGLFYEVHKERPFYNDLVAYMTSGPVLVAALQKKNAVADFRELIGSTDPANAAFGTIRRMFAESKTANAVHGSDSDENAEREISLFFGSDELFLK
ncbi:MAG TPA: nucleoside-diphosphate kinase [Prolixibacteraceae bacterium]|nr:nucleoside-diphosphate kinase [Prolixibacteraceae bacterium]